VGIEIRPFEPTDIPELQAAIDRDTFYTYMWLREDGTPYYVGKGRGPRGFISNRHTVPRPRISEQIITQEWPTEELAFEAERFLIAYYGRVNAGTGCLRNLTDGGEGSSGRVLSSDSRARMSQSHIGKKLSQETIIKRSNSYRGHRHSSSSLQKMAESKLGNSSRLGKRLLTCKAGHSLQTSRNSAGRCRLCAARRSRDWRFREHSTV
jgi:hypothetical protein